MLFTDCSCANDVELASTCLGGTIQNNAMGDYAKVCVGDNNTQVYQHSSNNVYLYYVANLEVTTNIFLYYFIKFSHTFVIYF